MLTLQVQHYIIELANDCLTDLTSSRDLKNKTKTQTPPKKSTKVFWTISSLISAKVWVNFGNFFSFQNVLLPKLSIFTLVFNSGFVVALKQVALSLHPNARRTVKTIYGCLITTGHFYCIFDSPPLFLILRDAYLSSSVYLTLDFTDKYCIFWKDEKHFL